MKRMVKVAGFGLPLMLAAASVFSSPAAAQGPATVPIIVADTAVPIIVAAVKPKPKPTGLDTFEGFVMQANVAQITVRAKGNDLAIRTFALSQIHGHPSGPGSCSGKGLPCAARGLRLFGARGGRGACADRAAQENHYSGRAALSAGRAGGDTLERRLAHAAGRRAD